MIDSRLEKGVLFLFQFGVLGCVDFQQDCIFRWVLHLNRVLAMGFSDVLFAESWFLVLPDMLIHISCCNWVWDCLCSLPKSKIASFMWFMMCWNS